MREKKNSTERYVRIQSDAEERIEDYKKFSESIFAEVYSQVEGVIGSIVSEKDKKHGDVISLIGNRGSGKTSVMSSVYKAMEEGEFKFRENDNGKVQFNLIERVDASLLDAREDVFDVILARMLNNVEQSNKDYHGPDKQLRMDGISDLFQQFNKVYEHHQMIKNQERDLSMNQPSLSTLKQFACSVELAEEFQMLAKKYLDVMNGAALCNRYEKIDRFLVVCVDDLDMNVQLGLQNLERIYRYVAVKNVIVIVAIKYEQMEYLTQKSGHNLFPSIHKEFDDYKLDYVRTYSREYLEKLLPIQRRIYMPNIRDHISGMSAQWRVVLDDADRNRDTVKQSLFHLIKDRTGMLFNITSSAPHLLEPLSLRELNGYFSFLNKNLEKPSFRSQREKLGRNCDRFLEDFVQRVAYMKLRKDYYQEFVWLSRFEDQELANQALEYLNKMSEQHQAQRAAQVYGFLRYNPRKPAFLFQRGYGELLNSLNDFGTEGQEELHFAEAILILYTCKTQKIYLLEDSKEKQKQMNLLLGYSWAGSWSNDLVPRLVKEDIDKNESERSKAVTENIQPRLWGCMEKINLRNAQIQFPWRRGKGDIGDEFYSHPQILTKLEWFCFCFEQFTSEYEEVEPLRLSLKETGANGQMAFCFQNANCNFNILAFIKNSYNWENYFDQIHEAVAGALLRAGWNCRPEDAKRVISEMSILESSYKAWAVTSGGMALPFQYTDIYSSVLQRVKTRMHVDSRGSITGGELWNVLWELFTQIEKTLMEEDREYGSGMELANNFKACPFVQMVFDISFTEKDWKWFGETVSYCADACVSTLRMGAIHTDDEF